MKASTDNGKGWFMVEAGTVYESALCCHKFAGDSGI